ncbi:INO80 complex subunit Ies4 [Geosmithia morbida]|uniref:INO80 complex subunit Ies4 n=1 Tax=Geosmithia morbida TaxID=1094350 RepID=A0A9P5D800_9HYPO|nr:INO80 complex subunit Ies4 [Geosmithia morbida]KAF4126275.1 INO80 complex subunit Ies4 [Geosmithia morbida]
MAPTTKPAAAEGRRKSGSSTAKLSLVVSVNVEPSKLRKLLEDKDTPVSEEEGSATPAPQTEDDVDVKQQTPDSASTTQPPANETNNASDSNAATPQAEGGTPAPPGAMPPPADGPKKKGVKRSAASINGGAGPDGAPKARGKPGPKKKPRLDDGTIDPTSGNRLSGIHKLGPKASLGAINAGLRALDRSGKPCRRWARGGFSIKTFTGVVWGVPRWTAPPKPSISDVDPDASAVPSAADTSSKDNKDAKETTNGDATADITIADATMADATMADTTVADAAAVEDSQSAVNSVNSNGGGPDIEMLSAADSAHASSPAPATVTASS